VVAVAGAGVIPPRNLGGASQCCQQIGACASASSARLFLPLVKPRIRAQIRHNFNGLFILNNDHILIAAGFARPIFGLRDCWRLRQSKQIDGRLDLLRLGGFHNE
jgi:hypothetical protein